MLAAQGVARRSKVKTAGIVVAAVLAVLFAAGVWYVNDCYRADVVACGAAADVDGPADGVRVRELAGGELAFVPDETRAGIVFYPGAKVQPESYAPLLTELARRGVCAVLMKPLFNLAILDDDADGVREQLPQVQTWLLAGHSMGGVAASSYLSRNADAFAGIVFLASYPTADLSAFGGDVLCMAGSADGVLNWDNYEAARGKLPADAVREVVEGGNHAQFGNYGAQAGDGRATISREEQQEQTAEAIVALCR